MKSIQSVSTARRIQGLALAAALAVLPLQAQEPSVILRDIDNLEKRVGKVEAELGRLRKSTPPAASAAAGRPDSSVAASVALLAARLDSLYSRLKSLETRATEQDAALGSAKPIFPGLGVAASSSTRDSAPPPAGKAQDSEIAELVKEVKALTALLKSGAPATGSDAKYATASGNGKTAGAASLSPALASSGAKEAKKAALELKGDIQIQGERKLTTQSERDNLDDFWGRLNFGTEYNGEDFQSKVNIRIFPEGFGFEPLTGATFDTAGQGSLKLQTQSQTRLVVNHAWVKYTLADYRLKVGRFETLETYSDNFGNYIDLGPSGRFMSRPAAHNALELSRAAGPFLGSAMLGTGDRRLNRGFLRLYGKYAPSKTVIASLGWKANLFDPIRFEEEEILQRYDASLLWVLPKGWKAFAEAALLQAVGREDDTPVLVGVQPFTGKVLDVLSLEVEWMPTRMVAREEKDFLFNVHARKSVGRLKLDLGLWSDLADPDPDSFAAGLRMTSGIK